MPLHDVIAARRLEILARWSERVRSGAAPHLGAPELVDHLRGFLEALIAALRNDGTRRHGWPEAAERLGFDLEALVHAYGSLHHAIIDTARAAGDEPSEHEIRVLFDAIVDGIAHAVSEYTTHQEAESERQMNESLAFIAHELGTPLFSALMALRILKTSGEWPAEAHAAIALERGLQQTMELMEKGFDPARRRP